MKLPIWSFVLILFSCFFNTALANIKISEVQYDTVNKNNDESYEWIELFNAGNTPVDVLNWKLSDTAGNTVDLPSFTIPAQKFALLANNSTKFAENYAGITVDIDLPTNIPLNNGSETLTLSDSNSNPVDFVAWEGGQTGWNLATTADTGESLCRINVLADTDVSSDFTICNNATPGKPRTTGPAGVETNSVLWLRADNGSNTTTNNTNVTTWYDQSGNNNNAIGLSANGGNTRPKYISGDHLHNFNPTMFFSGSETGLEDAPYFDVADGFNDFTSGGSYFSVSKSMGNRRWSRIFDFGQNTEDDNIWLGRENKDPNIVFEILNNQDKSKIVSLNNWNDNRTDIINASHKAGAAGTTVTSNLYKNGETLVSNKPIFVPNNVLRDKNYIARSNWSYDGLFFGEISEIIMYNRELNATEKASVESYLALKYGITLNSSIGDYLNTLGSSVYNLSTYNNHIVGIAKDKELDQRISKSQETGAVLTIATDNDFVSANGGARTPLTENQYLVLGSNNGALTEVATELPAGFTGRITREWKAQNTGNVGLVQFKFDIPAITGTDWYLVQSDTSDFTSGSANLTKVTNLNANGEGSATLINGKFYAVMESPLHGPADIKTNISLWLRADNNGGVSTDGSTLTTWKDQSGNNRNANIAAGTPTFENAAEDIINFNPVVSYDNPSSNTSHVLSGPPINVDQSIFYAVARSNSSNATFRTLLQNNIAIGGSNAFLINSGTNNAGAFEQPAGFIDSGYDWPVNEVHLVRGQLPTGLGNAVYNFDGGTDLLTASAVDFTTPGDTYNHIGGNPSTSQEQEFGDIAELIIYSKNNQSSFNRQKIESYLALKYGITINSTAGDYLNTSGSSVYNLSTYNNHIVGIAKDKELDQRISKSQETGAVLTIATDHDFVSANGGARTPLTENQYLVLGSNNGALTEVATELPAGFTGRITREWKIENTGNVTNTHLRFDGFDDKWVLFVDDDGDFSNGATNVGSLSATGEAQTTLPDGKYITLVKTNDSDGDGNLDVNENNGPNGGDADGDGQLDASQSNISSVRNTVGGGHTTLKSEGGACNFVRKNQIVAASGDPDYLYPLGLIDFRVECTTLGSTSNVTIFYDKQYNTANWVYRKKNGNTFSTLPGVTFNDYTYTTGPLAGTTVTTAQFNITDGDPNTDEDNTLDKFINDPSGPAVPIIRSGSATFLDIVHVCRINTGKCFNVFPTGTDNDFKDYKSCIKNGKKRSTCAIQWAKKKGYVTPEELKEPNSKTADKKQCEFKEHIRKKQNRGKGIPKNLFLDANPADKAYLHLIDLAEQEIVTGDTGTKTARLSDLINRAEVAKLLTIGREDRLPIGDCKLDQFFTDVEESSWYYSYVQNASLQKIASGYPDGLYWANKNINKAELYKMLAISFGYITEQSALIESQKTQQRWYTPYKNVLERSISIPNSIKQSPMNKKMTRGEVFTLLSLVLKDIDSM